MLYEECLYVQLILLEGVGFELFNVHNFQGFDRTFLFILVETQVLSEVQFSPHASLRFLFYFPTFFICIRNYFLTYSLSKKGI